MNRLRRMRSGTWLVVAMIGFGLLLTAGLYAYATLHSAPFRSLAVALAKEYPGTSPRVEGGKPRLDRPGETTLRITMRTPFDPRDAERADSFAREVVRFVAAHHDLSRFDVVEFHLFQKPDDAETLQRSIRLKVEDLERLPLPPSS